MNILAAIGTSKLDRNDPADIGPKEDSDIRSAPQSCADDLSHSPRITHALAVTTPQESVVAMDGQSATLTRSPSPIPASDNPERPQQVVEVASDEQKGSSVISLARKTLMMYGTIGYNGVPHWCPSTKWGRRWLWWLDSRHDSEHRGGKGRGKDEGGCLH